ncbi:hypothetical protein HHI36_010513 [Cryptolaemus montrouzieri]|uniref:Uncharacterized protein n=1 Tax=Cryptolaemus montrouzieri TaxID=559131 RepID=A0ABD2MJ56_9CUCU
MPGDINELDSSGFVSHLAVNRHTLLMFCRTVKIRLLPGHMLSRPPLPAFTARRAILGNPDLLPRTHWTNIFNNDFWGTPLNDSGSHGSYRPLCVLTFRLNYFLNGFQPWGYHLGNIVLHCIATILLVKVSRRLFPKSKQSLGSAITGLTFAAHPIHTEAVASVVGRADLAACNLYLMAFLAFSTHVKLRDSNKDKTVDRINKNDLHRPLNTKYQKIVHSLHRNVTSCHWTRRGSKEMKNDAHCVVQKLYVPKETGNHKHYGSNGIKVWIYLFVSIALAATSMLSKETGITVVGVCLLYDFVYSPTSTKGKDEDLDFTKAFGCIKLSKLLEKLDCLSLIYRLMESYLPDRVEVVQVKMEGSTRSRRIAVRSESTMVHIGAHSVHT